MIDKYDRNRFLAEVLPDIEPISKAPSSLKDLPWDIQNNPAKLEQWRAREKQKRYKSINEAGEIFLIVNPYVWESETITRWDAEGAPVYERWMLRPAPRKYNPDKDEKKKGRKGGHAVDWSHD